MRGEFIGIHLRDGLAVLLLVLWTAFAQVFTGELRVFGVVRERIEFVVAHHGESMTSLDHGPNNFERLPNLWPPVDEVAEKNHLAFGMSVNPTGVVIAKFVQQLDEFIGMAVNVTDQVVHLMFPFKDTLVRSPLRTEFGINGTVLVTRRLSFVCGYSLLMLNHVARTGDQIDRSVNPSQLDGGSLVGPPRPAANTRGADFWVQGLNIGLDYRW